MRMLLAKPFRLDFWRVPWSHHAVGRHKKRELRVSESRQQRLEYFNSNVYGRVEGWLGDRMWQIIDAIGTILDTNSVHGNIAEFGVHHGLFLFLLNILRNENEVCFAIDV